jgi:hypothetical protein
MPQVLCWATSLNQTACGLSSPHCESASPRATTRHLQCQHHPHSCQPVWLATCCRQQAYHYKSWLTCSFMSVLSVFRGWQQAHRGHLLPTQHWCSRSQVRAPARACQLQTAVVQSSSWCLLYTTGPGCRVVLCQLLKHVQWHAMHVQDHLTPPPAWRAMHLQL